jgi:dihydrofolate synthase / folylpolyglutamate synthase
LNLKEFLDAKGAEYAPFEKDRFKNFYEKHKQKIGVLPKIVQLVGTNGKGTTGRFLAQILKNEGFKTAHFTSPHIMDVGERFWFDGGNATHEELEKAHHELRGVFGDKLSSISYFEYLTLLCVWFFKDKADFLVLEAGLGGEFDSTTVFPKELLLVTKIGLDHQDILGEKVVDIARTKLRASNCKTVVAKQEHDEVYTVLKDEFAFIDAVFASDDTGVAEDFVKKSGFASYLSENLTSALVAAKILGVKSPKLEGLSPIEGRFQKIADNIVIDVGHNAGAARAIKKELGDKKIVLVFNCYDDKDAEAVLMVLKDSILRVEIIDVCSPRVIKKAKLTKILDKIGVPYTGFERINADKDYLVFGSFSVVSEFLRRVFEKKL